MNARPILPVLIHVALSIASAFAQSATLPLESLTVRGSAIPQPLILEIAGLKIGATIDKAGIERASNSLGETGLFASVSYRYAAGPDKGYAVTLVLADQAPLAAATLDVPAVDEAEAWRWLAAKFHRFDRQVPQAEPAQQYLARQFEEYLGARLHGQSLIVRIETDLESGRMTLSFRPEHLPRTKAVTYTGNQALPSTALSAVLDPIAGNQDYTDRGFASALELNLRPLYEQLGLYRVHFTPSVQWVEAGAIASVAITEGEPYRLGRVQLIGEELPVDAMLAAVKLPVGKPANWKLIQEGVWAMERVVKRTGYFSASAMPEREFDDGARTLNLRIRVARGPLYHFGELNITGLTPELAGMARRLWKPKPGDAYDFLYGNDFLQAFSRVTDLHNFSKHDVVVKKGATDHVMDITLAFEVR